MDLEIGMDREYVINGPDNKWWHTFTSKDIMRLCKSLGIPRTVRILASQSKYYNQDLHVMQDDYWGGWYQVKLCDVDHHRIRRYTFSNSKITISEETLTEFKLACQTYETPKDYINRNFSNEDIIFLRQFYRVKKVFGGFMLIQPIDDLDNNYRKLTNSEAKSYLIIDDPIVHLHI